MRCPCDQAKYEPSGAKATVQFSRPHFLSKGAAGAKSSPIVRDLTISFSLTLGGKLAIYGAPSDSGNTMRTQRQRREWRALRGVTRGWSPPGRGSGDGRGRPLRLLLTAPGKLPKASDQSTESNTDNRPCTQPRACGTSQFPQRCRPQTRH